MYGTPCSVDRQRTQDERNIEEAAVGDVCIETRSIEIVAHDEFVIMGNIPGRPLSFVLTVSGIRIFACLADGLVVATPAGSSGYSFAAGGPIAHPLCHAMIVTCICPRSIRARTLVVSPEDTVEMKVDIVNADTSGGICVIADAQRSCLMGESFQVVVRYESGMLVSLIDEQETRTSRK